MPSETHSRPGSKTDLTSHKISLLALTFSIVSFGFGIYQWWSSGRQERIRAAIDLSDRYIDQAVSIRSIHLIEEQVQSGTTNVLSLDPAKRQVARLEYIAFLVNHGLVNASYLAQRTVCDIVDLANPGGLPEALAFKNNYPNICLKKNASESHSSDSN